MKNRRKILTSLFFASVMALSLGMSAVAEDSVTSDTHTKNSSGYPIIMTSPGKPVAKAETMYSGSYKYIYFGDFWRVQTPGGTDGYITVEYGIYEKYCYTGNGYNQFMNYGISMEIVDKAPAESGLKADITIAPVGREPSDVIKFPEVTTDSDRLFYDFPNGYDYISLTCYSNIRSAAFGDVDNIIINRNVK